MKDACVCFLTGPGREGGRAPEHPQLPADHARGKCWPLCGDRHSDRGTERDSERAAEWSWWQNVHYNLWAGVMVHLNEWECESASALWQHEKWRNNGLNRMYSSVTIISILALKYHLLLLNPPPLLVHPYTSLFVLLTLYSSVPPGRLFLLCSPVQLRFLFSAGWEYPRCAPAVGGSNVWTPGVHDPCIWPEKWDKVNAAHTFTQTCKDLMQHQIWLTWKMIFLY